MKVPSLYKKLKQKRNAEKSMNQAQTRRTWIQLKMYEFYDWKYKPTTIKNGKSAARALQWKERVQCLNKFVSFRLSPFHYFLLVLPSLSECGLFAVFYFFVLCDILFACIVSYVIFFSLFSLCCSCSFVVTWCDDSITFLIFD